MKNLYHIFTADRHHLVPNMLIFFNEKLPDYNHNFLLIGKNPNNNKVYQNIVPESDIFIYENILKLYFLRENLKSNNVILHGVSYKWMIFLILLQIKKIHWICWGSGTKKDNSLKGKLIFKVKKGIFKRFISIGVLMNEDKLNLKKNFKLDNIYLLNYINPEKKFPFNITDLKVIHCSNIYIGNNSSNLNTYLPIIELLNDKFEIKDNVKIDCMLNYSFKESSYSKKLFKIGKEHFGDNINFNTKFYNLQEYYNYMYKCDIYICNVKNQSGLGAIYTCLKLGKKLYLRGENYNWINSLGCKVFHVEDLKKNNTNEFLMDLTLKQKLNNFKIISELRNEQNVIKNWRGFLDLMK